MTSPAIREFQDSGTLPHRTPAPYGRTNRPLPSPSDGTMTMKTPHIKPHIPAAIIAAATLSLMAACHSPGGPRWSADRFTFVSTSWQPKTVSLIDTRSGQTVWSVDVPVGQQISVGFSRGTGPNEYNSDEIVWGIMPAGQRMGSRPNRMPCPPRDVRRLDMTLRAAPELPGDMATGAPPREIRNVGGRVVEPINPEDQYQGEPYRSPFLPPTNR